MTPAQIRELRRAAETAAKRGGEVLRRRFAKHRVVRHKGSIDLVTDADGAAEEVILAFLRREFPTHSIVAEETAAVSRNSIGPQWYVDPLDGTTNYAHGVPHFCVSVGLWGDGQPLAGVVYQPLIRDLYSAGLGLGATLNGRRLAVSRCNRVSEALLATGFPYDVWTRPKPPLKLFTRALGTAQGVRRLGAAALDLAYVAAGRFDGYFELGLFPWDVAAGILLVEEAGGKVTSLANAPPHVDDRQILATNRRIHEGVRRALAG